MAETNERHSGADDERAQDERLVAGGLRLQHGEDHDEEADPEDVELFLEGEMDRCGAQQAPCETHRAVARGGKPRPAGKARDRLDPAQEGAREGEPRHLQRGHRADP